MGVGYGLDSNGTERGWPHVYGVPKPVGFKRSDIDKILDNTPEGQALFEAVRCNFRSKLTQIAGSFQPSSDPLPLQPGMCVCVCVCVCVSPFVLHFFLHVYTVCIFPYCFPRKYFLFKFLMIFKSK